MRPQRGRTRLKALYMPAQWQRLGEYDDDKNDKK